MYKIFLIITFVLFPFLANALGLGNIKVYSYLNQPLNAEIPLLFVNKTNVSNVRVSFAPASAYANAGLPETLDLPAIKFVVTKNKAGKPVVKLTSEKNVNDPIVTFMIALNWPGGELLRGYTILLNPSFPVAPPVRARVTVQEHYVTKQYYHAAKISSVKQAPLQANVASPQKTIYPAMPTKSIVYGPIKPGEDLWMIAEKIKYHAEVNIYQTMLAIYNKNPQAFYHGNISDLMPGKMLQLPTLQEVMAISASEAERVINSQKPSFKGNHSLSFVPTLPPISENNAQQNMQQPDLKHNQSSLLHTNRAISLEGKATIHLPFLPSFPFSPMFTENKPHSIKSDVAATSTKILQTKLALVVSTANSLEEQQRLLQMRLHDLSQQNQQLQQQLVKREVTLVTLKGRLAQEKNTFANPGISTGFSLTSVKRFFWLDIIFLCIILTTLSIIAWLFLNLRRTQKILESLVAAEVLAPKLGSIDHLLENDSGSR